MAMTAREAAWSALQRWRKNGAWSDAALNIVLQNAQLAPRDAALAARICYGTLQNLALLERAEKQGVTLLGSEMDEYQLCWRMKALLG